MSAADKSAKTIAVMIVNRLDSMAADAEIARRKAKLQDYCQSLPDGKQQLIGGHFPELIAPQPNEPLDDLVESIRAAEFEEKGASQ